jgi:hypothetical protein
VILNWSLPEGVAKYDHYSIYRDGLKIGESVDGTFLDNHLMTNATYTYTVRSFGVVHGDRAESSITVKTLVPTVAYLTGKIFTRGNNLTTPTGTTAGATEYRMSRDVTGINSFWYDFETPVDIGAYNLNTGFNTLRNLEIRYYDSSGNLLYKHFPTGFDEEIYTITPVLNVSRVGVINVGNSDSSATKFNVYAPVTYETIPAPLPTNIRQSTFDGDLYVVWDHVKKPTFITYSMYINGVFKTNTKYSYYKLPTNLKNGDTIQISVIYTDGTETLSDPKPLSPTSLASTEISSLTTSVLDRSVTFNFQLPTTTFLDYAAIYRNGELVGKVYPGSTSFVDRGLTPETPYNYLIRAVYKNGETSLGLRSYITTLADTFAPSEVANLSHTSYDYDKYRLNFTLPTEVDFKQVNIYENGTLLTSTTSNVFDFGEILPGNSRTLRLTTVDELGNESTGKSYTVSIPNDFTPPGEVTSVSESLVDSSYSLVYTLPSDHDFDHVNVYKDEILLGQTPVSSYIVGEVLEGETFTYKLTTVDRYGNESTGVSYAITRPDVTAPSNPSELSYTVDGNGVTLSFSLPTESDFSHFNIYVDDALYGTTLSNNYIVSDFDTTLTHSLRITSVDNAGNESSGTTIVVDPEATEEMN